MATKGKSSNFGRVACQKCGATSTKTDFGTEKFRITNAKVAPLSNDPKIVARRNRAAALRKQNNAS